MKFCTYSFLLVFVFLFNMGNSIAQSTIDCSALPTWNAATVYSTPGMEVVYQGVPYTNNFWTQGDDPSVKNGVSGSGMPWTIAGTCTTGTTGNNSSNYWNLQGNIVNPGQFIGTLNSQALILKANNLEALYVNPQKGSVSIGQAFDPYYYKFEVNGGLTAFTGPNQANQNNILTLYSGNQSTAKYAQGFHHYIGFSHGQFSGEEYGIMNAYEYNASSSIGRGKHLLIQNTAEGNLGIGVLTAAPAQKLVVNGNAQIGVPVGLNVEGSRLYFGESFDNTDPLYLARYNTASDKSTLRMAIGDNGDNNDVLEIGWMATGSNVWTAGVRIGANGTIVAKEVCVNLTLAWCDYVFEEDYKLMSLKELKAFIQKYKHLPEIPSTREMEASGLNLNQVVTLQMKKIEELTLYTIQQENELVAQKKEIEDMRARLEKLEQMITNSK